MATRTRSSDGQLWTPWQTSVDIFRQQLDVMLGDPGERAANQALVFPPAPLQQARYLTRQKHPTQDPQLLEPRKETITMKNALEVLTEMDNWWHRSVHLRDAPTPAAAIHHGITYLHNDAYDTFEKLQQEASKVGHIRSLFTVWKAVVARLPGRPFYDPSINAALAFPAYIERFLPEVFVALLDKNVFLGIKFSDEDRARHQQLQREYAHSAAYQTRDLKAANQMLNRNLRKF